MPSKSSHLISEYANLQISGLRRNKKNKDKEKKGNVIPKVFDLVALFTSVNMSATKYVLPETASLLANVTHHEERDKSYPNNTPN